MAATAHQIEAVERLVRESIGAVDALAPSALRALFPALRAARDEARKDLAGWLGSVGSGDERFTGYQRTQALRALEATLERVEELAPAMSGALKQARTKTGPLAVANLETEIQRLSAVFGGGVPTIPQISTAAVLAKGDKLLWRRHETSARRYAGAVGDDIKHLLAVGVAKGETFEQLVTRLRRIGNPRAPRAKIDLGHDADAIADGLFVRHKHMADRLVRTEMMQSYNVQHDAAIEYANENRIDGDDEYLRRWDAAADVVVCDRCKALDRTVTTIKGTFAGGVSSPPLHPYCRCTVLAWLARWGGMKGEVPVVGKVPIAKKTARPPGAPKKKNEQTAKPIKTPKSKPSKPPAPPKPVKVAKPPKTPKPLPVVRQIATVSPKSKAIVDALGNGDHTRAAELMGQEFDKIGLVPSSTRNHAVRVTEDGLAMTTHSGNKIVARAYRKWSGEITLAPKVAQEIQDYANTVGHQNAADMRDALEEHSNKLYALRIHTKPSLRHTLPNTDDNYARISKAENAARGINTLVHESLHGYSPLYSTAYRGAGGQIEEITVETSARVLSNRMFGIKILAPSTGSYAPDIHSAVEAIAEMSGKHYADAWPHLQEASLRFKRRTGKLYTSDEVVSAFADDIATELGVDRHHAATVLRKHLEVAAKVNSGETPW